MNISVAIYVVLLSLVSSYLCFLAGSTQLRWRAVNRYSENTLAEKVRTSISVALLSWASSFVLYIYPAVGYGPQLDIDSMYVLGVLFYVTILLTLPVSMWVMLTVIQLRVHVFKTVFFFNLPVLAGFVWYLFLPTYSAIVATSLINLLVGIIFGFYLYRLHKRYVRVLQSEYGELERRTLSWIWIVYAIIGLQHVAYVLSVVMYMPVTDFLDIALAVVNATALYVFTDRMLFISPELADEEESDDAIMVSDVMMPLPENCIDADDLDQINRMYCNEEYIRQRLIEVCEKQMLYIDPTLTRDVLCQKLGVNRTYLYNYFQKQGLTYYRYINNLRIEYAKRLIESEDREKLCNISMQCGFNNYKTFRLTFKELVGCLPSEYAPK